MNVAEADIAKRAAEVPPGSFRHTVLLAAKRFKASWTDLGKLLVRVRDEALFEGWGYPTFDAYCLKELHIRKQTADKLTRAWNFLGRHEPEEAQAPDIQERAPAFEVVEVLADAEARGQLSPDEYRAVRESIWNPERPASELKRELGERFPRPAPAPPADDVQVRRLAQAMRRLAQDIGACAKVPRAVADRAGALAADLEELASGG